MPSIDWATSSDIEAMLAMVDVEQNSQELRLFSISCAKRVLPFLKEEQWAKTLDYSVQFSNRTATEAELAAHVIAASALINEQIDVPTLRDLAGSAIIDASSVSPPTLSKVKACVSCAAQAIAEAEADSAPDEDYDSVFDLAFEIETSKQCTLLRQHVADPHD